MSGQIAALVQDFIHCSNHYELEWKIQEISRAVSQCGDPAIQSQYSQMLQKCGYNMDHYIDPYAQAGVAASRGGVWIKEIGKIVFKEVINVALTDFWNWLKSKF
jgi:hypothetical protein